MHAKLPTRRALLAAAFAFLTHTGAAQADQVIADNLIVTQPSCIGTGCFEGEVFGTETLMLKDIWPVLLFEDSSIAPGTSQVDWEIQANDGVTEFLRINQVGVASGIFKVDPGSPAASLTVGPAGVGVGTAFPQWDLHVLDGSLPSIMLEQDGSQGFTPQQWKIVGWDYSFTIFDQTRARSPFYIRAGAEGESVVIHPEGVGGLVTIGGVFDPEATLHVQRGNGTAKLLVAETSPTTSPRTLLNLRNNGRPEIAMGNTATNGEWSFGAGTNFVLKQGAVGSDSSAKFKAFEIDPAGNATLTGTLTTGGTTCGTGCDAVFAPDYPLPSISEHAAAMRALGHLPNVGPTPEGAPVDVTDKLGRMLNELEHAHLYIAQQNEMIAALAARVAALEAR